MDTVRIEGMKPGRNSRRNLARKQYTQWQNSTKESRIYKAVLFALAGGKCPTCYVDMILSYNAIVNMQLNAATLDHTIPLSKVLEHHKYGLEIMCRKCNGDKADKTVEEFINTEERR